MKNLAIETENLTKYFRDKVVDSLNLQVEKGSVYGFVGPNGAGKTTTIRMILGLITPTKGKVKILGHDMHDSRHHIIGRVGAMIEIPTFYPSLSGRANLELLCYYSGRTPRRGEIERLLDTVELLQDANREVCQYSLGMKQRLGLATVLLDEPELLILDEPCNGLDPDGIQQVRILIKRLTKEEGKTVFLTSHSLSEVQEVSDAIGMIVSGKLVRQESLAEMLGIDSRFLLKCRPLDKAIHLLNTLSFVSSILFAQQADYLEVETKEENIPEVLSYLATNGISVFRVEHKSKSLEEVFFESTEVLRISKAA